MTRLQTTPERRVTRKIIILSPDYPATSNLPNQLNPIYDEDHIYDFSSLRMIIWFWQVSKALQNQHIEYL